MPHVDNPLFGAMGSFTNPELMQRQLPPINDFIARYDRGGKPYPRQATLLKIIFLEIEHLTDYDHMVISQWMESSKRGGDVRIPLDLYERMEWCKQNGYKHFKEVIFCGGRRGGKGFLGGKIAAYKVAQMISLGSPQRYYDIDESKTIYLDVLATNFSQAKSMLFADIRDAIVGNEWLRPYIYSTSNSSQSLQTPADRIRERKSIESQNRKNSMRQSIASIAISPSSASSASIRGRASFMQCFDEFAHGLDTESSSSSSAIYEAATPSLYQFDKDAMIYIPSSPWSETGKFFELYEMAFAMENGSAANPQMFAIKIPSWEVYYDWQYDPAKKRAMILSPQQSREMRQKELQNPESFDVEFRANFAKTENAYMNQNVVDSLFAAYPSEDENKNVPRTRGIITEQYRAHADAGRSQDNFCFAIGHKEVGDDGYWHVYIDEMKVWQPSDFAPDESGIRRVDYVEVADWLRSEFKSYYVTKFTMDQWNSAMVIDEMRRDIIEGKPLNKMMTASVDNHTSKTNFQRWERFKTACYQGWVHIPYVEDELAGYGKACLAEVELKLLVMKNGKVDHQTSAQWNHNDMADCISTVVSDLLADQLAALDSGNLTRVVGAAYGGYNGDIAYSRGSAVGIEQEQEARSQAYMEQMGYLGYL